MELALSYGDVGFLVMDNRVDAIYCYKVIYPKLNNKNVFCLLLSKKTLEETQKENEDNWRKADFECGNLDNASDREREIGTLKEWFEDNYAYINGYYYNTFWIHEDYVICTAQPVYRPYKTWFCIDKKIAEYLVCKAREKRIKEIKVVSDTPILIKSEEGK